MLACLILSACGQKGIIPAEETLSFYTESALSTEYPYVASGDKVVFHRHFGKEDDENIADDEYSEDFFFALEEPGEDFTLDTEDLKEQGTLFLYYCYCGYTENVALIEGSVSGNRVSATKYAIEADVTYEYYHLNEDGHDTLSTYTRQVTYSGLHERSSRPN